MSELQRETSNEPTAVDFVAEVLAAVELAFSERFGARWSPEIQSLYQETQSHCLAAAERVDARLAPTSIPRPIAHARVLTNYRDRTRR